jgi:hypothetical protein
MTRLIALTAFVLFVSICCLHNVGFSQTAENNPAVSKAPTAEELSDFRSKYIEQLYRSQYGSVMRRQNPFITQTAWSSDAAWNHRINSLQLMTAEPGYVPFTIAPPGSAIAGLFTNPLDGGMPMRMGDSNILIYPNDPTNGFVRRGMGWGACMWPGIWPGVGTVMPGTAGWGGGFMPFVR